MLDNLNIRFIYKEAFFDLQMNDSNSVALIYEVGNKYGVKIATYKELNMITKDFYKIPDISKPIKGVSSYKLSEILEIAGKLKIDQTDKKTL